MPSITSADRVVTLPADEAHHLARVLRARLGDEVRVFDGRGQEWDGPAGEPIGSQATVDIAHEVTPAAEPHVRVTLAIGLLKGDQMDSVVRDATMLGAFAIVPMSTKHVAVPSRALEVDARRSNGGSRVAMASAKQCGRAVVPDVKPVTPFEDVLGSAPEVPEFMCVEPSLAVDGLDKAGASRRGPSKPSCSSGRKVGGPRRKWSRRAPPAIADSPGPAHVAGRNGADGGAHSVMDGVGLVRERGYDR